jgi:hypothetical protein
MEIENTPNHMNRFASPRPWLTAAALFVLSVAPVSAHPGHALNARPVVHLLTSPYHLLTVGMIGAGLLFAAIFVKHLATRRALQLSGLTALALTGLTVAVQLLS